MSITLDVLRNADGTLHHGLPVAHSEIPDDAQVCDGVVWWRSTSVTAAQPGKALLERFVRLHTADDAKVAAFVRSYGVPTRSYLTTRRFREPIERPETRQEREWARFVGEFLPRHLQVLRAAGLPANQAERWGNVVRAGDALRDRPRAPAPKGWVPRGDGYWIPDKEAKGFISADEIRFRSCQVAAVLSIAAALADDRRPSKTDWLCATFPGFVIPEDGYGDGSYISDWLQHCPIDPDHRHLNPRAPRSGRPARYALNTLVNDLMRQGQVTVGLAWSGGAQLRFQHILPNRPLPLEASIAVQVLFAAAGAPSLAMCSGCAQPYFIQGRLPNPNRNRYCAKCGRRAAVRDANRRLRRRKRQ